MQSNICWLQTFTGLLRSVRSAPVVQVPNFTPDKYVTLIGISGSHGSFGQGRQDKMAGHGHRIVFT